MNATVTAASEAQNPSTTPKTEMDERSRVPMSLPTLKLAVPEIPGFYCHWMRGDPMRMQQAQRAGYVFV
jgi:hypothetical protein